MKPSTAAFIRSKSQAIFDKVKGYREYLHQNPELSYKEFQTMEFVSKILGDLGIEYVQGVGKTGVVGIIRGDHHAQNQACIGLRADLDALPIHEENEVPYKSSKEGIMHACGHDVHTSVLLGTAEILQELRNELPQPVKLIFQPGEEKNPGGATLMIADKALENPEVTRMYALHVFPELEVGSIGFKEGLYMASCDEIYITIHGKGGHGATPHLTVDPIFIGATLITNLQNIVSRKCDPKIPCVLSFGYFAGLGATNVIPSQVQLKGTFRTMDESWRAEALDLIKFQAEHIAESFGGTASVEISKGYPFLTNDPITTADLREKAIEHFGEGKVIELPIRLTAEDFAYYSQLVPVCFFRLGVRNEEKGIVYGVHHPKFDIDPEALITGMQMMSLAAF
jgi:amidohydrolase